MVYNFVFRSRAVHTQSGFKPQSQGTIMHTVWLRHVTSAAPERAHERTQSNSQVSLSHVQQSVRPKKHVRPAFELCTSAGCGTNVCVLRVCHACAEAACLSSQSEAYAQGCQAVRMSLLSPLKRRDNVLGESVCLSVCPSVRLSVCLSHSWAPLFGTFFSKRNGASQPIPIPC